MYFLQSQAFGRGALKTLVKPIRLDYARGMTNRGEGAGSCDPASVWASVEESAFPLKPVWPVCSALCVIASRKSTYQFPFPGIFGGFWGTLHFPQTCADSPLLAAQPASCLRKFCQWPLAILYTPSLGCNITSLCCPRNPALSLLQPRL